MPLLWCHAAPAGPIEAEPFERIAAMLCAALADAGVIDCVVLDLHGTGLAAGAPDAEGELPRRFRASAGGVPVAITLEPYAGVTALTASVSVIVPIRTWT